MVVLCHIHIQQELGTPQLPLRTSHTPLLGLLSCSLWIPMVWAPSDHGHTYKGVIRTESAVPLAPWMLRNRFIATTREILFGDGSGQNINSLAQ